VALVTEGSALTRPGVREQIGKAVERATGHPVLFVDPVEGSNDRRRRLAAQLAKKNPELARYDWREPHCPAGAAAVLVALASNADAVYRVALDGTAQTRPITLDDLTSAAARGPALWKVVVALGGDAPRTVREETVVGNVGLSYFAGSPSPPRARIKRRATHIGPGGPANLLDPAAIAAGALRDLPPPRAPEWGAYARRLLAAGCPLLAISVGEARLGADPTSKKVRTAALDAMRRNTKRRPARALVGDAVGRAPFEATTQQGASSANEQACQALCSFHMIELCNNDVQLWIEHRVRWEATPCGTRRQDAFLEECYRHQWQSGNFDDACVTPCETTPEARGRLESMLQRAGCLTPHDAEALRHHQR
jgi:hypothetical protein